MDRLKSLQLEKEIKGLNFNGFTIIELINNGKSAAVFKAEKDNELFAFKIFDHEIVEKFGHEIQNRRIEQEISLSNHSIQNLVKILDGGKTNVDGQDYYYIIMEFIDGLNLKEYIKQEDYSQGFILKVLETLYTTTEQLLIEKQIVHRDIKPENIMVSSKGDIILMDLGVLKLVGAKSFSDEEEKSFVGTLRYAAPEFLLRIEVDSLEGWRAVNFYQIGATLHDLIMKTELFVEKTPYSNLVIAIKDDTPKIVSNDYSYDLIQITRDMLTKDWKKRLQLINKDRILKVANISEESEDLFESSIEDIFKMRLGHLAKFEEIESLRRTKEELQVKRQNISKQLTEVINSCFKDLKDKGIYQSISISQNFKFNSDHASNTVIKNHLYELKGELKIGFPANLYIFIRTICKDDNYVEIETFAMFPDASLKINMTDPLSLFRGLNPPTQTRINAYGPRPVNFNSETINIFTGIIEFDDAFRNHLNTKFAKLIHKALQAVENYVNQELNFQQQRETEMGRVVFRESRGLKRVMINFMI